MNEAEFTALVIEMAQTFGRQEGLE